MKPTAKDIRKTNIRVKLENWALDALRSKAKASYRSLHSLTVEILTEYAKNLNGKE